VTLIPILIMIIILSGYFHNNSIAFVYYAYGSNLENTIVSDTSTSNGSVSKQADHKMLQPRIQNIPQPRFLPWGGKENDLTISTNSIANNVLSGGFIINGTASNKASGFSSYQNYNGKYISLIIGKLAKKSRDPATGDPQVSFDFYIKGQKGDYQLMFVNGRLNQEGWKNNTYFSRIDSYSSKLVSLKDFVAMHGDVYSSLKRIGITFEKNIIINPLQFRIDFYPDLFPNPNSR
jgi:hypothetical protein